MAITIELIIKEKSPIKVESKDKAIGEILQYLNDKTPEWEEFVLSNKFDKQIRIIKSKDKLTQMSKSLAVGNLLVYLDKNYKDWNRFAVSKIKFPEISYSDCSAGMLVRANTSNTNQYVYVDSTSENVKGEKEINCNQEGQKVTFNTVTCSKYKFSLLAPLINKSDFESIDWAEFK